MKRQSQNAIDNTQSKQTKLDDLTRTLAIKLSRRNFLTGLFAAGTVLGLQMFMALPASASSHCAENWSCCTTCTTSVYVCSPNNQYCATCYGNCSGGCPCGCYSIKNTMCNDGSGACDVFWTWPCCSTCG
jgi:hypothetical protein